MYQSWFRNSSLVDVLFHSLIANSGSVTLYCCSTKAVSPIAYIASFLGNVMLICVSSFQSDTFPSSPQDPTFQLSFFFEATKGFQLNANRSVEHYTVSALLKLMIKDGTSKLELLPWIRAMRYTVSRYS